MKSVAVAAGVSAQLVVLHFGSKEGGATACDEYILRMFREHITIPVAVAFFGLAPAFARSAVWVLITYALTIGKFGIGGWGLQLSPFAMVPRYPAEDVSTPTIRGLLIATVGLLIVGFRAFRSRDLATTV